MVFELTIKCYWNLHDKNKRKTKNAKENFLQLLKHI